ncbi:MAG: CapA family protein [Proteobacteria bacterium]|nr:CapA family protein [Pseudomonadota bacterium]
MTLSRTLSLVVTGDVNLMNVDDAAVPFRRVQPAFAAADVVFSNLECCLYTPPAAHSVDNEGFYVDAAVGQAVLRDAGIAAVGLANNVNYGADAIGASIAALDAIGVAHTGAGATLTAARAPAIVERNGVRIGFLQRTSVYWPTHHEARADAPGVAVIRGHTAYQVPAHKERPEIPPMNRPGIPPVIITWADRRYLDAFAADIAALRRDVDYVVASCHWGLWQDVLDYMTGIAHAAIDAGADVVVGHGPHYALPVEVYRGKPVFYGLGSFSFHSGHGGRKHGDWVGEMAHLAFADGRVVDASLELVRHNDANETVLCAAAREAAVTDDLIARSRAFGTTLTVRDERLAVALST